MILSLEITPLPVGQFVELFPGAPEDHVELRVAQVLLKVAAVHVTGQAVVVGEQEMKGINVGSLEYKYK